MSHIIRNSPTSLSVSCWFFIDKFTVVGKTICNPSGVSQYQTDQTLKKILTHKISRQQNGGNESQTHATEGVEEGSSVI